MAAEIYHRIYTGTPEKVSEKKRVLEISSQHIAPLYKAMRVDLDAGGSVIDLKTNEILITHSKITSEVGKNLALARAGCSEIVIVVEALLILEGKINGVYKSMSNMHMYQGSFNFLLNKVKSSDGMGTFSRFCYAICLALEEETISPEAKVALKTGKEAFEGMWDSLLFFDPNLVNLQAACIWSPDVLMAWGELYKLKQQCHQMSHPFAFIGGDTEVASNALSVLEYVAPKYTLLDPLIRVALPLIIDNIKSEQEKQHESALANSAGRDLLNTHFKELFE